MTDAIVVDASVAVKWVLEEELSERAHFLLLDSITRQHSVVAPPLLPSEVTNAIYQRQRRRLITSAEADQALSRFLALPVHLVVPADLFPRAVALARQHGLNATYDSQYLAVAQSLKANLWTADTALIKSLPRSTHWVRWIGDYRSPR